jgi:hypothetical protein
MMVRPEQALLGACRRVLGDARRQRTCNDGLFVVMTSSWSVASDGLI